MTIYGLKNQFQGSGWNFVPVPVGSGSGRNKLLIVNLNKCMYSKVHVNEI
jgi:hypothetical protein